MVKIRLARIGRVNAPLYTIVALDGRSANKGKFLQKLGSYNPKGETPFMNLNVEGIVAWLDKGAALTDTLKTLFKKNKIDLKKKK